MADDFEHRIKALEDREAILYKYMDEQRRWALESREEHQDSRQRFEQNEKRIEQNEKRIEQNEEVITDVVKSLGLILLILERIDQKVDDLGKPGKNGQT